VPITTTPSGGPQGEFSTYTPIYAQTLSSTTSSVTFSNIPTTFTDLVLVFQGTVATNGQSIIVRFNNDTNTNYSRTTLRGSSTTAESVRVSNTTSSWLTYGVGASSTAQCSGTMTIQNYSNTTTYKTALTKFGNVSGSAGQGTECGVNMWRSTSPITSLTISAQSGNMNSGCTFTLYGIKAAAAQFIPTKAFGGDVVVSDGTYAYHAFKTSGSFVPYSTLSCDVLVVAGGGGGALGGGGAGGYRSGTSISVSSPVSVTVGAGGSGGLSYGRGTSGSNSVFSTITSTGGGTGGPNAYYTGNIGGSGGSGGGGGGHGDNVNSDTANAGTGNAGGYSPVEGYAGGVGVYAGPRIAGGGGGGASAVGTGYSPSPASSNTITTAGNGGSGSNAHASWASATGTGVGGYYAGGGAGGGRDITPGSAGAGGGGFGGNTDSNSGAVLLGVGFGIPNTGGGGGGTYYTPSGSGGSGIVIVRYAL
jgi:hypothetical protein